MLRVASIQCKKQRNCSAWQQMKMMKLWKSQNCSDTNINIDLMNINHSIDVMHELSTQN